MLISDWSSDVCSSDPHHDPGAAGAGRHPTLDRSRWRAAVSDAGPAAPPSAVPVDIPYGFARAHGVVIAPHGEGGWLAKLRDGADPPLLLEVKRYPDSPMRLATDKAADFDRLLSDHSPFDAPRPMPCSLEVGEIHPIAPALPP